jgi:hypothetical protein
MHNGWTLVVEEMDKRRIARVRLEAPGPPGGGDVGDDTARPEERR